MFKIARTNVIESDAGFSVEVLGRTGLLYTEGLKSSTLTLNYWPGRQVWEYTAVQSGPGSRLTTANLLTKVSVRPLSKISVGLFVLMAWKSRSCRAILRSLHGRPTVCWPGENQVQLPG